MKGRKRSDRFGRERMPLVTLVVLNSPQDI